MNPIQQPVPCAECISVALCNTLYIESNKNSSNTLSSYTISCLAAQCKILFEWNTESWKCPDTFYSGSNKFPHHHLLFHHFYQRLQLTIQEKTNE